MPRFDATSAECLVFVFKEGVLAAIGHDLQLRVGRFTVDVADAPAGSEEEASPRIDATFDAASLTVVSAMKDGRPAPDSLSARDRREIEKNIARDVLDAAQFPTIRFVSTAIAPEPGGHRITGTLWLHGRERTIDVHARDSGDQPSSEVVLHQPEFGIKPYSALLGTLRVKADVTVQIRK